MTAGGPRKARPASMQKRARDRLERLYEISKHLAIFESTEKDFPRLLSLAASVFPLSSAVLIERRGEVPKTTIWPATGLGEDHKKKAIAHARKHYSFLADMTPTQSTDLDKSRVIEATMKGKGFFGRRGKSSPDKFFVLPIVLGRTPVFGVLQFETFGALDEGDLAFVDALTNLIAVALDRSYRIMDERTETQARAEAQSLKLVRSQGRVTSLEEEQVLREQFVSYLSHDLKTPLTAAKMSALLVLRKPESAENCQLLARRIVNDIDRADRMIEDLLDANRIRAGEPIRLDVGICDLRALANGTLGLLRTIHGDRFVLDAVQQEVWGYWDRDGLRRVIENLVNNAVKYGSPDRPVTIALRQSQQGVRLMVHNEGEPIPARDQAGLFRRFTRTGAAQSGKKKGWGLGLALVQGIVHAHGGKVSIESSRAHGTTFTVVLPNDSRPQVEPKESASA